MTRHPVLAAPAAAVAALLAAVILGAVPGPPAAATGKAGHRLLPDAIALSGRYRTGGGSHAGTAQEAAVAASAQFRSTVGAAATAFAGDVASLQQAVAAGDVTAARADELAAQAQYDAIRYLTGSGPATSSPLDETAADVPSGGRLAGLHLVERDLWDGGNAAAAVAPLVSAAPMVEVGLSRIQLAPRQIDLVAMGELGWVTSVAVPGLEELYSHLDTVDVAATVGAASAAFEAVAPVGRLVTPGRTATAAERFAALGLAVRALGTPGTVPDSAIPEARWRSVAEDADAAAAVLGALAPPLAGYGPRQIYGYNA